MLILDCGWSYLLGLAAWMTGLVWALRWLLFQRIRRRGQPAKQRWINLGLSAWMILFALTLPEMAVAFFYDQSDSFNLTNVSKRWFQRHVKLNDRGFRDVPWTRLVPEGHERIAFMGDSFVFGHGVNRAEDRLSEVVARGLAEKFPRKYVVVNLGKSGIGTHDLRPILEQTVWSEDASLKSVTYVICLNDIEWFISENYRRYEGISSQGPQLILFRDTYFYNWLYYRVRRFSVPAVRDYFSDVLEAYQGPAWQPWTEEIRQLRADLAKHNCGLRMVIFPFLHNLGEKYPFHDVHVKIVNFAQREKIPVLDLEPILKPHVGEGLTVNRFDAHPNERAHQLAGEAMLKDLLASPP